MPQQARTFGQSNMTMYKKFSCWRMFSLSFAFCLIAILFMAELQGVTAHRVAAPWDKLVHASVYGFLSGLLWCGMVTHQKFWRILVLMAILGMAHEWLQFYLPGRSSFHRFVGLPILLKYSETLRTEQYAPSGERKLLSAQAQSKWLYKTKRLFGQSVIV